MKLTRALSIAAFIVALAVVANADTFIKLTGTGVDDAYQVGDRWGFETAEKVRSNFNLIALGNFGRNQYGGGSMSTGVIATSTTVDIPDAVDFEIDNTGSQLSASAGAVIQLRIKVRVENSSITATPIIYNVTDGSTATSTGGLATSATATDFSGSNSSQTLTLTPASGIKKYRPRLTIGANATGYTAWAAAATWDIYIP